MSHETGGNWLSIAQACQLFGVSDRTVKRRIEAGEIQSKLENLPRGGVRRLVLVDEREGHARDKTARDVRDTEGTRARDTSERETQTVRDKTDERAGRAGQTERDTRGTNGEVELLHATVERDREEIQFLRGLVEQRDRDAAELRAALREALKAMPKALPEGTAPTPQSPVATAISPDEPTHASAVKVAQIAVNRDARPLWKVVLGIR